MHRSRSISTPTATDLIAEARRQSLPITALLEGSMGHYADQFIRLVQEAPEPVRRSVIAHLRLCAGLAPTEVR